jgi:DNA-3-methyladenine glycosylase II
VRIVETGGTLVVEVVSNSANATVEDIQRNVIRILSLDGNESEFAAIGRRDPVVADLQARYPGLRPVQFASPYEAAAWAVMCQRIQMAQAVRIKNRIAADLGTRITFTDGQVLDAFPAPIELRQLGDVAGLTPRRVDQLHSIADAARAGELDARLLLSVPPEVAMHRLQRLPGVGPFSAELIVVRGAGARDMFPQHEPRLSQAMAILYGTDDRAEHERISGRWRPYRSWISVLIRGWFEDDHLDHDVLAMRRSRQASGSSGALQRHVGRQVVKHF